jgi:cyanophycinase
MRPLLTLLLFITPLLAAPPYPPEPVPGSLVIVGGGKMPEAAREEFVKLAGGPEKAKVVVIPTASASADEPKEHESFLKQWKDAKVESVVLLHTRDRKTADADEFVKPLADATGIWFSGGDQSRLTAAYLGTKVEAAIKNRLQSGAVAGGTSAGAAVMSDLMIEGGNPVAKTGPGLGFLPGVVVDQHFTQRQREKRLVGVIEANPTYAGLGIDEGTAVVLTKGRLLKVLGEGSATVVLAKSATRLALSDAVKSGGTLDLFQIRRAAHFRSLKEPFPAKAAAVPEVAKGSLVIVGGGGVGPEIIDRFLELAGGKDKPIVFVATAGEDLVSTDPAEVRLLRRAGATNLTVLHTRDRRVADTDEFSKALTKAGGVWFSGGRQWRFVDAYEGTLTAKRFQEVLARGGVIGGSSAGASIQSEYMPRGHPLGNTVVAAEGYERGFGYLPGCAVDQHFFARNRTKDMTGLMKLYPQLLGIGLDEGTAIVVTGHTAEVVGKSKVGFYDARTPPKDGEKDYVEVKAGEKYDLKARKVLAK